MLITWQIEATTLFFDYTETSIDTINAVLRMELYVGRWTMFFFPKLRNKILSCRTIVRGQFKWIVYRRVNCDFYCIVQTREEETVHLFINECIEYANPHALLT